MLTREPNSSKIDSLELEKIQAGHMVNIHKMAAAGKLKIARPSVMTTTGGVFLFLMASPKKKLKNY